MLFRQMKYFAAVVECNSFTEAAEQCYISQSAISQQIRALEKELGVELIHRENRKFTLTPAGEYFYSQSKGILEEVDDIRRETIRIGQDDELQLLQCGCYAELSVRSHLSSQETVELESLKRMPCTLISSREQQNTEQDYFQNTLGFGGKFLFAENLEENTNEEKKKYYLPALGAALTLLYLVDNAWVGYGLAWLMPDSGRTGAHGLPNTCGSIICLRETRLFCSSIIRC